jgi:predicted Zn finger-like uncharacterized protein
MFTTCPNCTLKLALTASDLRTGQGYVRCGRCGRVFNALISLTEELPQETVSGLRASGTDSLPALPEEAGPESAPEPEPAPSAPEPPGADAFDIPIALLESGSVKVVENRSTGTFETIVLEGDSVTQTEELVDQAEVEHQLRQIADQIDADELAHVREELKFEALNDADRDEGPYVGVGQDVGEGVVEGRRHGNAAGPRSSMRTPLSAIRGVPLALDCAAALAALLLSSQVAITSASRWSRRPGRNRC